MWRVCNVLLSIFEADGEVLRLHVYFAKGGASNGWDDVFTRPGLRGMLEGKDFRSLDNVFPFVVAFTGRRTGHLVNALMTSVHTYYS